MKPGHIEVPHVQLDPRESCLDPIEQEELQCDQCELCPAVRPRSTSWMLRKKERWHNSILKQLNKVLNVSVK